MNNEIPHKERKKIFLNNDELLTNIKVIIKSSKKKKSDEILKIIFSERKFFPSEELANDLSKEIANLNDNEIGELSLSLQSKLSGKHDPLGEKLKDRISIIIKERINLHDEIENIFENNDLKMLKDIIIKITALPQKTEPKEMETEYEKIKTDVSNPLFLLFTVLYRFNKSADIELVLWHFIKSISSDTKNINGAKYKTPSQEILYQTHIILKRKNAIKLIKKYLMTVGPYYEVYKKFKAENEDKQENLLNEKRENDLNKEQLKKLSGEINSLQTKIGNYKMELERMQFELEKNAKEHKEKIEEQTTRNLEIIGMEKKSLYSKIKKDVFFSFNEIKIGLSRDVANITKENVELLLQRIDKTEKILNDIGGTL